MNGDELERFRSDWQQEVLKKSKTRSQKREPTPGPSSDRIDAAEHEKRIPGGSSFVAVSPVAESQSSLLEPRATDRRDGILFPQAQSSSQANPSDEVKTLTALQTYEKGVEKERQGLLSDALIFYRRAFKMDAAVDNLFRDAFRAGLVKEANFDTIGSSVEDTNYAKFIQTSPDYDITTAHETSEDLEQMIRMMASLRMPIEAEKPGISAGVASLPEEILHQILTYVVVGDAASSFTALSLTCQKFFLILQDETIWRDLCIDTYHHQVYSGAGIAVSSESEHSSYLDNLHAEAREQYQYDWKRMFIEKPRIRMDGCYIATCHYTRPGVREESLVWTSPIHLVTYFRFLRFFPNGDCLSLLTTSEPKDVIHQVAPGTKLKGVQRGRWSITRSGELSIEASGPASYTFFMELQIKSSSRGRQNKLSWKRFYGVHPHSSEITTFNLKNDRAFYYSKVKSYSK